ncbi:hypothetical protein EQH57_1038, partial [Dictyocoela roeselum]
ILTLYNTLVRPLLEYAVQCWSPTLVQDIERLERVQARATKMITSIRHKGCQRRLRELNFFIVEKRRLREQLIETFKILKGFNNIEHRNLFMLNNNPSRNHELKLQPKRSSIQPCADLMTNRIDNAWNRLLPTVIESESVDTFKRRLDRILHDLNY